MVYNERMDASLLREHMHVGLGRRAEVVIESPKWRKHAQSSAGHLETNYFVDSIRSQIINREAILVNDLIKNSVVGSRRNNCPPSGILHTMFRRKTESGLQVLNL